MADIHKQKVVIIGHSSTLRLGTVRAIAELGCEIIVVVMTGFWRWTKILKRRKQFDCYSKYISHIHYCPIRDGGGLINLLMSKCKAAEQKVILIPLNDFSTAIIDDNKGILSEHFLFPHIKDRSESIRYWMEKENQKKLARRIGLNVPDSWIVNIQDKLYNIPKGINYPCFTKALTSTVGGKGCFNCCRNQEELSRALDRIGARQNVKILIEDYKDIEKEYAILGFSSGRDVVIPGIIHLRRQTCSHFGVAMIGEISPIYGFEEFLEQLKLFVIQIGFVGLFDIDFYYSENKLYFGEINLRFGGSGYAVTKSGVNLPAMFVRYLRGEDISDMKKQIQGSASYVNERMCEDDWCAGAISTTEYHKIISSADISFVKDDNDPRPYTMFRVEHCFLPVKKLFKKILAKRKWNKYR